MVTNIADFGNLLPNKYLAESTRTFAITTPDGGIIMDWINESIKNGDNEFYLRKCLYKSNLDPVIISKSVENDIGYPGVLVNVSELNRYYSAPIV